jgi:hypothetical protein
MLNVKLSIQGVNKALRNAALEAEEIADDEIDQRIDFAVDLLRQITPIDTGYARARWRSKKFLLLPGGEISNDAPYINRLNQGSSKQAPALFIERALLAARLL